MRAGGRLLDLLEGLLRLRELEARIVTCVSISLSALRSSLAELTNC